MENEKLKDVLFNCNAIQGLAIGLNETLRSCIVDLSEKINEDNYGTRTSKDGTLSDLINNVYVINQTEEIAELIGNAVKDIK